MQRKISMRINLKSLIIFDSNSFPRNWSELLKNRNKKHKKLQGKKTKRKVFRTKVFHQTAESENFQWSILFALISNTNRKKKLLYIIGDPKIYIFQLNFWNRNPLENYTFKINSMNGSQQKFVSLNKMKSKKLAHISRISSLTKLDALYICVWIVCII